MEQFFIMHNQNVHGPVDAGLLRQWAADGHINPDHWISTNGRDWAAAHTVKGLFQSVAGEEIRIRPPATPPPAPSSTPPYPPPIESAFQASPPAGPFAPPLQAPTMPSVSAPAPAPVPPPTSMPTPTEPMVTVKPLELPSAPPPFPPVSAPAPSPAVGVPRIVSPSPTATPQIPITMSTVPPWADAPGLSPSPATAPMPPTAATMPPIAAIPHPATWFYMKNGQTIGPLPEDALKGLAQAGVIAPDDAVWPAGATSFSLASQTSLLAGIYMTATAGQAQAQASSWNALSRPDIHKQAQEASFQPFTTTSTANTGILQPALKSTNHLEALQSLSGQNPVSDWWYVRSFWAAVVLCGVGLAFPTLLFLFPPLPYLSGLVAIVALASSFRALLYCWRVIYPFCGRKWPTPGWAVNMAIIPIVWLFWSFMAHGGLGKRINHILRMRPLNDGLPSHTSAEALGYAKAASLILLLLVASTDIAPLGILVVIMNAIFDYLFLRAAIKDTNRILSSLSIQK